MPGMLLGQVVPNFDAETSEGKINFHEWLATPLPGREKSWTVMVSHPADFTPVCTTELGGLQKASTEFFKRNVKLIAMSCDDVESHIGWIKDIKSYNSLDSFSYPIIADPKRVVANLHGMMDPDEKDAKGIPLTCRLSLQHNIFPLSPNHFDSFIPKFQRPPLSGRCSSLVLTRG